MPLEGPVNHISDLNQSNPPGTDGKSQGDDHIRNIKTALRTDFPNINAPVNAAPTELNLLSSALVALCVLGRSANTAGVPAAIVAASDGQVLRRAANAIGFGTIDTASPLAVTHPEVTGYNTATVVVNASVAFVDLTGVLAQLEANSTYAIEIYVESNNTGAGGMAVKATFTSATLENQAVADHYQSAIARLAGAFTAGFAFGTAGAGADYCSIRGRVRTNLATTMQIQVSQNAAAGINTFQIGCWIKATRLN